MVAPDTTAKQCGACRHAKEVRSFDDKRLFSVWRCTLRDEYVNEDEVCVAYKPRMEENDNA